jgi:biopolymer transport protein ExbD
LIANIDVSAVASVLLVLFALSAPPLAFFFPRGYVPVDLAKVSHPKPVAHALREDAIMISVRRNGDIYFDHDWTPSLPWVLDTRIRESLKNRSEAIVYIHADARCKYHDVKSILDAVYSSGVDHVVLLVTQREPRISR